MDTNAAIWVRVSTDRQHEHNQIPDLERLCDQRDWKIARRYEIADASAYKGEHREALTGHRARSSGDRLDVAVLGPARVGRNLPGRVGSVVWGEGW